MKKRSRDLGVSVNACFIGVLDQRYRAILSNNWPERPVIQAVLKACLVAEGTVGTILFNHSFKKDIDGVLM